MTPTKIISLSFLGCAVIALFLIRELVSSVWGIARLPMPADWVLMPSDIIAVAAGVAVFVILIRNVRAKQFVNDVILELERVTWPERKETLVSTGVVAVLVGICALILFLFDLFWGSLVNIFYQ